MRDEPLQKRFREWAKTEPETMATKLGAKKPERERVTPYRTLAELLVDLHVRTGVPIVADGFRLAIVAKRPPDGPTLEVWNRSLNPWTDSRYRGYRPLVRTSGGWVMFRHPQYWKMIPREVPERPIAALEAAWRKPGHATLDDYAAFAGQLTPLQSRWVGMTNPVMEVPGNPLDGSMPFLRLWSALSAGQRRIAVASEGLSVLGMSRLQSDLFYICFEGQRGTVFGDDETLPYWLPGGPPLPRDMRLFVDFKAQAMPTDWVDPDFDHPGHGYDSMHDSVPAVSASLGTIVKHNFTGFSVPLSGPQHRE